MNYSVHLRLEICPVLITLTKRDRRDETPPSRDSSKHRAFEAKHS